MLQKFNLQVLINENNLQDTSKVAVGGRSREILEEVQAEGEATGIVVFSSWLQKQASRKVNEGLK
jgi:hypothetical protein